MRLRLAGSTASSVRMLCSRSASLTRMTRTSRAIASSILRKLSACCCFAIAELDLVELRQAVDHLGDRHAHLLAEFELGDAGVLEHVVQQRGHQRIGVELPATEDFGDRDRVRDVRLAARAELPEMRLVAEAVGVADAPQVVFGQIGGASRVRPASVDDLAFVGRAATVRSGQRAAAAAPAVTGRRRARLDAVASGERDGWHVRDVHVA